MTTGSTFFARSRRNARTFIDAVHACLNDLEEYEQRGGSNFSGTVSADDYAAFGMTQSDFDYYMAQFADYKAHKDSTDQVVPSEKSLFAALLLVANAE